MRIETEAMRHTFRSRPKSFLDAPRRDWQFAGFGWLLRHCGGHREFLETVPVLPIEEHFPDRGLTGHAGVAALFRRIRDHAGMADWPCIVEPEAAEPAPADNDGLRIIRYDTSIRQPMVLVAQLARGLANYLVDSFEEPPPGGTGHWRPAIDLAAVFMGFGVFMVNASVESGESHLSESELVHALALFCLLRGLETGDLEPHLNPHLRKYLRLAADDLARYPEAFRQLRATPAWVPMEADGTSGSLAH